MDREQLILTWQTDLGMPGVDEADENPLSRATNRLFRLGKPFDRLGKCFYAEPDLVRWFGIFVHSAGDRILFFPGVAELYGHVVAFEHQTQRWNQPFQVDHLSLERNWKSWHLTSPRSKGHLGKLATTKIDADRTFWFSMSVPVNNLRLLMKETRVMMETPARDTDRRAEEFTKSRDGMEFPLLRRNTTQTNIRSMPVSEFLHFCVVVGPPGFPPGDYPVMGLPYGSPFLRLPPPKSTLPVPTRLHRLSLSETVDVEIMVSSHPGRLTTNVVYSCAASGKV